MLQPSTPIGPVTPAAAESSGLPTSCLVCAGTSGMPLASLLLSEMLLVSGSWFLARGLQCSASASQNCSDRMRMASAGAAAAQCTHAQPGSACRAQRRIICTRLHPTPARAFCRLPAGITAGLAPIPAQWPAAGFPSASQHLIGSRGCPLGMNVQCLRGNLQALLCLAHLCPTRTICMHTDRQQCTVCCRDLPELDMTKLRQDRRSRSPWTCQIDF